MAHAGRGLPGSSAIARTAVSTSATLRVGIIDSSYDSMPHILHEVQARDPALVIHQVEASVPGQYQQLTDGRLDIGVGRAAHARPRSPPTCSAATRGSDDHGRLTGYRIGCETTLPDAYHALISRAAASLCRRTSLVAP